MNTSLPVFTEISNWDGEEFKFEIFKPKNFEGFGFISQAYGFILNDENELLLISHSNNLWSIPGGHVEGKETTIDGLIRELYEETAAIVEPENCIPFFIQQSYKKIKGEWIKDELQARYLIKKVKFEKFKLDPDQLNPVIKQKFFKISELKENLKWGRTTDFIIDELLKLT